ncbi:hypothetical protein Tco_0995824, partial [Tanacetum coccineum]
EAVYKELDDSLVRAATTVSSLEAEQDSGNIINTRSKATPNEAGSQGTTSGGGPRDKESLGEDASKQGRISDIDADDDITLVNVQDDAEMFDVGDLDGEEMIVAGQKENVVAEQEVVAKDVNLTVDEVTLAQALAAFKSAKPKVKGIVIEEPSIPVSAASTKVSTGTTTTATIPTPRKGIVIQEASTTTTTPTTIIPIPKPPQNKGKGIMFEEPMAKVEANYQLAQRMQAQEAEEKRNKPPTKTQQKKTMITYLMNMEEVIPDKEEVAIDAIPLAVKPPNIVDGKIHKEEKKTYYQIIRADGSSNMYLVFSHILKSFDGEDLETLWKLVKAKHRVLEWKLYDSCGVHFLRMQHMQIYMLVEKKYYLTPATITDMLNKKLQCDHLNEMAYQLLKLLTKQLKNL